MLVGERKLVGGGAATSLIKKNAAELRSAFEEAVKTEAIDPKDTSTSNDSVLNIPRYARVNTLKTSVEDAVQALIADGFRLVDFDSVVGSSPPNTGPSPRIFARDRTLDDVLLFPHRTDLHDHPLVCGAQLRLQDKASCFPAHVLLGGGRGEAVAFGGGSSPKCRRSVASTA